MSNTLIECKVQVNAIPYQISFKPNPNANGIKLQPIELLLLLT